MRWYTLIQLLFTIVLILAPTVAWAQCPRQQLFAVPDNDRLGISVCMSGDLLIAGAPFDDEIGLEAGAAYIYRFDGTAWVEEVKLLAAGGEAGDRFGIEVSIRGDVAVVSNCCDSAAGGSANVFRFNGVEWIEEAELLPSALVRRVGFRRRLRIRLRQCRLEPASKAVREW